MDGYIEEPGKKILIPERRLKKKEKKETALA